MRHRVTPSRFPISRSLRPLRRGSTLGARGRLRGIDASLAAHLRATDPAAANALRKLATGKNLLHATEEWCLWLLDSSQHEIGASPFLRDRVPEITASGSSLRIGLFNRIQQPRFAYRAVPLRFPRFLPWIPVYGLGVDVIIDASAAAIDDEGSVTAGVLMSRPYRVWVDVVGRADGPESVITINGIHNTFPLPELDDDQFDAIGDAADVVVMACRFAMTESIVEIYQRDQLPDTLQAAHDRLDALVCGVFGISPDASDEEIADRLLALYRDLSAGV